MTFLHFIRRTHLYMGLFLLPWMIMFGVSTIPINHTLSPTPVTWTQVAERQFGALAELDRGRMPGDLARHELESTAR